MVKLGIPHSPPYLFKGLINLSGKPTYTLDNNNALQKTFKSTIISIDHFHVRSRRQMQELYITIVHWSRRQMEELYITIVHWFVSFSESSVVYYYV